MAHRRAYEPVSQPDAISPDFRRVRRGDTFLSSNDEQEDTLHSPHSQSIRRKPVVNATVLASPDDQNTPAVGEPLVPQRARQPRARIYWWLPAQALLLFVVGFFLAIGHHLFLRSLNHQPVLNQVWTNRFSLAMAFIVKSALSACCAIAYVQKLWHSLYATHTGASVGAVDALFTLLVNPTRFGVGDIWRSAPVASLMAAAVWLLPLVAVVSPTALTVTSLNNATTADCMVPTINMTNQAGTSTGWSLSTIHYTESLFEPSMAAQRLAGLAARNGQQSSFQSPCGTNCSYPIEFVGPAWSCRRTDAIDDPAAAWHINGTLLGNGNADKSHVSFWFGGYGDGSNYTLDSEVGNGLDYDPVYAAGVNPNTTRLWFGATNAALPSSLSQQNESIQAYLDIHVYYCDLYLSNYKLNVSHTSGVQTIDTIAVDNVEHVLGHEYAWAAAAQPSGCEGPNPNGNGSTVVLCNNLAHLDTISLAQVLIDMLQGTITRDAREILVDNTTLALVPKLVGEVNNTQTYGQLEPAVPLLALGPLLEQLSQNVTISLLSEPRLQVVNQASTSCTTYNTLTVWAYDPLPLAISYAVAVGAALISLAIGAYAVRASGVARDTSFSAVVRSTRHAQMDQICSDRAGLPTDPAARRLRVKLMWGPHSDGSDQFQVVDANEAVHGTEVEKIS